MDSIKIEVYGGINLGGGGCGCGCTTCTPADAKAEYQVMEKAVLEKFGSETVSLEFIDTGGVKLDSYPEVEKVIRAGYSFPVILINGSPRLAGGISAEAVADIVEEIQANQ